MGEGSCEAGFVLTACSRTGVLLISGIHFLYVLQSPDCTVDVLGFVYARYLLSIVLNQRMV